MLEYIKKFVFWAVLIMFGILFYHLFIPQWHFTDPKLKINVRTGEMFQYDRDVHKWVRYS